MRGTAGEAKTNSIFSGGLLLGKRSLRVNLRLHHILGYFLVDNFLFFKHPKMLSLLGRLVKRSRSVGGIVLTCLCHFEGSIDSRTGRSRLSESRG